MPSKKPARSSVKVLLDSNILIDFVHSLGLAKTVMDSFDDKAISLITWMELMVGVEPETEVEMRAFLSTFVNLPIDGEVAGVAASLRRAHKIKLPDAIIWATAQVHGRVLVTTNTKDFSDDEPGIHVPYRL